MNTTNVADIDPPANVLLLHDAHRDPPECDELCCRGEATAELRVSYANDPIDRTAVEEGIQRLGLVSIGDVLRSGRGSRPDFSGPIAVDAIDDPSDLSAIGLSVSQFCEEWSGEGEKLVVCFRSLDSLLRHSQPKVAFEFLYVLTKRLSGVGAFAHFHLDPSKHEEQVVAAFGSIFDAVVATESARSDLPEATDEQVAQLLAEWGDGMVSMQPPSPSAPRAEATDEDIARSLPD